MTPEDDAPRRGGHRRDLVDGYIPTTGELLFFDPLGDDSIATLPEMKPRTPPGGTRHSRGTGQRRRRHRSEGQAHAEALRALEADILRLLAP